MGDTVTTQKIRFFCPSHGGTFLVAKQQHIECPQCHFVLTEKLAQERLWAYCFNCLAHWPSSLRRGKPIEKVCPACALPVMRRYLCAGCNTFSIQTNDPMDGPLGMEPQCPCCQAIFGTSRHTCKRVNEQFIISGTCPLCSTTTPTIIRKVETTQPESAALTRPGEVYDESTIVTPPPKRAARTTASLKLQDLETEVERLQTLKQSEARQLAALLTEMAQLRIYRTTDNRTLQELRAELTELRQSKADALEIQQLKTEIKRVSGLFEKLLTERSALQPSPVIQPPRDNIAAVAPKVIAKAAESYISPYAVANWFLKSPFAIEECLSELAQPLVKATQDFRTGELREDDAGKFILLQDKSLAADLRFVLPNQTRFQQAQVFARYESCYECQHPASGKVWVLRLAVARRAAEQVWQVVTKGELEIR